VNRFKRMIRVRRGDGDNEILPRISKADERK